ncbi:hypothetical protein DICPUDRAFT_83881 [Dictyostelium purpureum]|uniref:Histone chaperone domain-containing protein n=1 Tax=Dictyostelium purpureum TaxID=5786 RepID=F1A0X2_DICPU|nr:uncharacterized protein DICPUDRAFT_83881 [Dictyostelium purpureum]EGC30153.1 hypothetical protein DICPUDRAFT_83881 [Dictyostelium purpureum]|eukprot:XP_003293315.1 hypothetical protein DICPUDRAFT_83881 [Dictyostelium purpureum]
MSDADKRAKLEALANKKRQQNEVLEKKDTKRVAVGGDKKPTSTIPKKAPAGKGGSISLNAKNYRDEEEESGSDLDSYEDDGFVVNDSDASDSDSESDVSSEPESDSSEEDRKKKKKSAPVKKSAPPPKKAAPKKKSKGSDSEDDESSSEEEKESFKFSKSDFANLPRLGSRRSTAFVVSAPPPGLDDDDDEDASE